MGVARNVALDPRLVPGGGAVEMAIARGLNDKASTVYLLSPLLVTEVCHGLVTHLTTSDMHPLQTYCLLGTESMSFFSSAHGC